MVVWGVGSESEDGWEDGGMMEGCFRIIAGLIWLFSRVND